jgi:hypothetical protein
MKRIAPALLCGLLAPLAQAMPVSCKVGDTVLTVSRSHPMAGTAIYRLRQGRETSRLLFDGEPDDSRGTDVRVQCTGTRQRVMVLHGEFMSAGYPKGFVMLRESRTGRIQRLDFAERNAPGWLYLGPEDRLLVFPPGGRMETRRRYLVYRFAPGPRDMASTEDIVDALPDVRGYELIRFKR